MQATPCPELRDGLAGHHKGISHLALAHFSSTYCSRIGIAAQHLLLHVHCLFRLPAGAALLPPRLILPPDSSPPLLLPGAAPCPPDLADEVCPERAAFWDIWPAGLCAWPCPCVRCSGLFGGLRGLFMPSPGSSPTCHGQAIVRAQKCLRWGNTFLYGERSSPVQPYPGRSVPFQCEASLKAKVHSRHQRKDTRGQWGLGLDPKPLVVHVA